MSLAFTNLDRSPGIVWWLTINTGKISINYSGLSVNKLLQIDPLMSIVLFWVGVEPTTNIVPV